MPVLLILHGTASSVNADVIPLNGAWVNHFQDGMYQTKYVNAKLDILELMVFALKPDFMMDNLFNFYYSSLSSSLSILHLFHTIKFFRKKLFYMKGARFGNVVFLKLV